jgi:PPE family protein
MNDVRWEGFTHEEIYARVQQGPGRGASADAEAAWTTVATTIRDVDAQLTRAAEQIGVGWHGAAAENVRGGLTVMSNWALDAAGDAELTRDGITAQADAAAHVRTTMPAPRTEELRKAYMKDAGTGLFLGVPNAGALEDRMAEERIVAVELMNRYTSDSSSNQRLMNYWTPPPRVVVETVLPEPVAQQSATGAGLGLLAPAGVVARSGPPGVAATGAGRTATRGEAPVDGVPPGVGVGPAGAGVAPAGGTTSRSSSPGTAGVPVPGGAPTRPPLPGAGPAPRAELPGGVRPVVPGPPPRGGAGPLPGGVLSGGPTDAGPRVVPGPERGGPGPTIPRGLPAEPPLGVLGAPPGSGPTGGAPAARGPVEPAAGRGGTATPGAGFLPFGGMAGGSTNQDHRRPDYLVDDTDVFGDDRWFTPAVLGADDADDP